MANKVLYHADLAKAGPTRVAVLGDPVRQKKGLDRVPLRLHPRGGEPQDRDYEPPHQSCLDFWLGAVGKTFTVVAEGDGPSATLTYVGEPGAELEKDTYLYYHEPSDSLVAYSGPASGGDTSALDEVGHCKRNEFTSAWARAACAEVGVPQRAVDDLCARKFGEAAPPRAPQPEAAPGKAPKVDIKALDPAVRDAALYVARAGSLWKVALRQAAHLRDAAAQLGVALGAEDVKTLATTLYIDARHFVPRMPTVIDALTLESPRAKEQPAAAPASAARAQEPGGQQPAAAPAAQTSGQAGGQEGEPW